MLSVWDDWRSFKIAAAERLKEKDVFDSKQVDGERVSECQRGTVSREITVGPAFGFDILLVASNKSR